MNQIQRHWQYGCSLLLTMTLAVAMLLPGTEAQARLKVTTSVSANVKLPKSINRSSGAEFQLFCDGYNTLIVRDEEGKTQVYVNDDGGNFSTDEKYRVEIEELGLDWRYCTVYGGVHGKDQTCKAVKIRMEGGHVGKIILAGGGKNNVVQGNAALTMLGGTVTSIVANSSSAYASIQGNANIILNDVKYMGKDKISYTGMEGRVNIFINNNCEFFEPTARFGIRTTQNVASIFAPDSLYWESDMFANGTGAAVPKGFTVTCNRFFDYTEGKLNVAGKLIFTNCSGWLSDANPADFPNVIIPEHKHVEYIFQHATCEEKTHLYTRCTVCNEELPTEKYSVKPLVHIEIEDKEPVKATCWREGRGAGTHCARCGETLVSNTIDKTKHSYLTHTIESGNLHCKAFALAEGAKYVQYKYCEYCWDIEMISGTYDASKHQLVSIDLAPNSMRKLAEKLTVEGTCSTPGIHFSFCVACESLVPTIAANGHTFKTIEGVEPTCTKGGTRGYKQCTTCKKYFDLEADEFEVWDIDPKAWPELEPYGHRFCKLSTPVVTPATFIQAADCTHPAQYKDVCAVCGVLSDNSVVTGEPAKGHHYRIRNVDCVSAYDSHDGDLTLECEDCGKLEKGLPFTLVAYHGESNMKHVDNYWCKSELMETTTMPTCVDGEGIYRVTVNYHGQLMRETYTNVIPACGYLHNYSPDGICHEAHFVLKKQTGTEVLIKDDMGNLYYEVDEDGQLIPDKTKYVSEGYIVMPFESPFIITFDRQRRHALDPESGTPMTFTDYTVTQVHGYDELNKILPGQQAPFYAGTFGEYNLNKSILMESPWLAGIDTHEGKLVYRLEDANPYALTVPIDLYEFSYYRTFDNDSWKPLYVPFAMDAYELYKNYGIEVARLNDTHMYDYDFDGRIDELTLEFIRMTEGVVQANRPYMMRTRGSKKFEYGSKRVALQPARETTIECSTIDQKISITGTYKGLTNGELFYNNYYAMNSQGGLQRAKSPDATLAPQRWYLKIENKDGSPMKDDEYFAAEVRVLGASDDEEVTGISDMEKQSAETEPATYRLDGQRVTNTQQPGLYVSRGQRIMVK